MQQTQRSAVGYAISVTFRRHLSLRRTRCPMPPSPTPILTLGFAGEPADALFKALDGRRIECLVDIRSAPDADSALTGEALRAACGTRQVRYVYLGDAVGERCDDPEAFERGIAKLCKAARQGMRVAVLAPPAAEEHRRDRVGAALTAQSIPVEHLAARKPRAESQPVMEEWDEAPPPLDFEAPPDDYGLPLEMAPALPPRAPSRPRQPVELEKALPLLREVFGYDTFRPVQEAVIRRVLAGDDTLAVMPTGGGKSLCYQLPALLFDGLTVVVSPLISLMRDQVEQLRPLGITATFLNSSLSGAEYAAESRAVAEGKVRLLYLAPETLVRPETQSLLDRAGVQCFAIDEAHCISQWGHDFRPVYRNLMPIRQRYPEAVCIALTATAAPRVRQDIRNILGLPEEGVLVSGFDRPNLFLGARRRQEGLEQLLEFLRGHPDQPGIVYCGTQAQTEAVAADLAARGITARPYHAGLDSATRTRHQQEFNRDEVQVIAATVAFGMGINKPNIRFVVHYSLPESMEGYYQEVGRAGRDGMRADCLLLWGLQDARLIGRFIDQGAPAEKPGRQARLNAMIRYGSTTNCRRSALLPYFGDDEVGENCGMCDNCTRPATLEMVDITEAAQKFLTAVQQTGQGFGCAYVVDVLRGSRNQRILDRRHENLKVYGTGKEHSAKQWRAWADVLLDEGLLEQDLEYGTLRLTRDAQAVLRGERQVMAAAETALPTARSDADAEYDAVLFERLRTLRRTLAEAQNLPPYAVFSDRTLAEMARHFPQSPEGLLTIHGVGQQKLNTYGEAFLEVLREYCTEHGIAEQVRAGAPPPPPSSPSRGQRCETVGRLFNQGKSLPELESQLGIQRRTLVQHLNDYVQTGGELDPERVLAACSLSDSEREAAVRAFEELGVERLRPVFDRLGERVPYDELHLVRILVRMQSGSSFGS